MHPDDSNQAAIRSQQQHHLTFLSMAVIVVVLSFVLRVCDDERVALRFLPNLPMPETCLSRQWFHVDCPGCGLTRSFIRMAEGNWLGSLSKHRLGWLLILLVGGQFPYRLHRLWTLRTAQEPIPAPRWATYLSYAVIAALLVNWLLLQIQI